uniref:DNA 3'-5' helicase n=1 Tax=Gadus morhua TaxID=8049 RepID=A0A8C5BW69_GADMO
MENDVSEAIQSVVATLPNIEKLKPEQEQALLSFVGGHDVVGLLPTGFRKSLIFQLAPLLPIVIVVSPLVALMEDQVKEAEQLGVRAGQLGVHDDRDILDGSLSLVFGSPESWLLNNKCKTLPQNKQRVLASLRGEGNCRIVVSTTALGMRLHFANVSHVVMYGAPGDLEAILQQAGRAGRHGQPSHAILYNTGQYFKVDEEVKKLLAVGKTTCFRKSLHAHFEARTITDQVGN